MDREFAGVIADTHVHIYPQYDLQSAIAGALRNLGAVQVGDALKVVCLTERVGQNYFEELRDSSLFNVVLSKDPRVLILDLDDEGILAVVAGRQFVAGEGFEVLGLGCLEEQEDRRPAIEIIRNINSKGGVAVLPWSPGKWMFSRGKKLLGLVSELKAGDVVFGDIRMRPSGFQNPTIITEAKAKGFNIIAGTDPLGLSGEEDLIGSYGVAVQCRCTVDNFLLPFLEALRVGRPEIVGKRDSLMKASVRWGRAKFIG